MTDPAQAERLRELAAGARAAGRLALDTEFMGEGRYRTLLCLVQLAIPEGQGPDERIMILDPLEDDLDGSPLTDVLADPQVRVVVHAGRQDVALLRRRFRAEVTNVFDTQVAAGFAGLGAQSSYDSLLPPCWGCGSPRPRASPAGTPARCRPSRSPTRGRTWSTCSSSRM